MNEILGAGKGETKEEIIRFICIKYLLLYIQTKLNRKSSNYNFESYFKIGISPLIFQFFRSSDV